MIDKLLKIVSKIGIWVIIIYALLWFRADEIYGVYADMVRNTMLIYFVAISLFSPITFPMLMSMGFQDIAGFVFGFILTAPVMLVLGNAGVTGLIVGQVEASVNWGLIIGFGFLHSFIKAFSEELIFRGAISKIFGDVVSSILFGAFHYGITGVSIIGAGILMALGFLWAKLRDIFRGMGGTGLMASTGSHFAYNLGVMGILPLILGGL